MENGTLAGWNWTNPGTTLAFEPPIESYPFWDRAHIVNIVNGVLGSTGIILNLVIIWITFRLKEENFSTTVLRWLAIYDMSVCIHYGIRTGILRPMAIHVQHSHDVLCRVTWWTLKLVTIAEQGEIQLLSLERVVAVTWPIWYKMNMSQALAHKISAAMLLFYTAATAPYAYYYSISPVTGKCYGDTGSESARLYENIINVSLISILPNAVLIISNIIIITKIKARASGKSDKGSGDNSVAFMLMSVCVVFVLCFGLYLLIEQIYLALGQSNEDWAERYFWYATGNFLKIFNSSVNFFLYILTNSKFKAEFLKMVKCQ